ncbi:MAG: hypothetical protein SF053_07395 [Bacteroidia bacterium]|nr:hypothetical protein [Bacteroidia bacterium]
MAEIRLRPQTRHTLQGLAAGTAASLALLVCLGPGMRLLYRAGSHTLSGSVHGLDRPGGLQLTIYRDADEDGQLTTRDETAGFCFTDDSGRFEIQIHEGRTVASRLQDAAGIHRVRDDGYELTFAPLWLPADAEIQGAYIQVPGTLTGSWVIQDAHGDHTQATAWSAAPQAGVQSEDLRGLIAGWRTRHPDADNQPVTLRIWGPSALPAFSAADPPVLVVHYTVPQRPYLLTVDPASLPDGYAAPQYSFPYGSHDDLKIELYQR